MDRKLSYTIVIGPEDYNQRQLYIDESDERVDIGDGFDEGFTIGKEQLGELGFLFMTLAYEEFEDAESVYELLKGYGCHNMEIYNFAHRIKEIAKQVMDITRNEELS